MGNKTKLMEKIISVSEQVIGDGNIVADPMAGTGLVSLEFRKQGYSLISSDIMTYSYHHLKTNLLINEYPLFNKLEGDVDFSMHLSNYECVLSYLNNINPKSGFFFDEFSPEGSPRNGEISSRKYFTSENARKIDGIRLKINEWIDKNKLTDLEESLLKHTLILSVNEVANISGTYGYFLSEFNKSSKNNLTLKPVKIDSSPNINHIVKQGYAENIANEIKADLMYLDPPYIKRQYAANYHILETIARGDFPDAVGKSGLRNWRDQYSNFCTKTKGIESFEKVIRDSDCSNYIISYSEDGLFTIPQLIDALKKYGKIELIEVDHKRFKSNNSKLAKKLKEYLIIISA